MVSYSFTSQLLLLLLQLQSVEAAEEGRRKQVEDHFRQWMVDYDDNGSTATALLLLLLLLASTDDEEQLQFSLPNWICRQLEPKGRKQAPICGRKEGRKIWDTASSSIILLLLPTYKKSHGWFTIHWHTFHWRSGGGASLFHSVNHSRQHIHHYNSWRSWNLTVVVICELS